MIEETLGILKNSGKSYNALILLAIQETNEAA